jgi:hypothetical protein
MELVSNPESKTFGVFLWYQFNTAVLVLCYITFFIASGESSNILIRDLIAFLNSISSSNDISRCVLNFSLINKNQFTILKCFKCFPVILVHYCQRTGTTAGNFVKLFSAEGLLWFF